MTDVFLIPSNIDINSTKVYPSIVITFYSILRMSTVKVHNVTIEFVMKQLEL